MQRRRLAWPLALVAALAIAAGCEDVRARWLLRNATKLGAEGRWSEALHYYERLWLQFPDSPLADEARLKAARIYAGPEAKPRSAEELYRKLAQAAAREEVKVLALLELAELYTRSPAQLDKAIEVLEVYLQRQPVNGRDAAVSVRLAELYLQRGMLAQAVQEADAWRMQPDPNLRARALLVAGEARELAHQLAAALSDYVQAASVAVRGDAAWLHALEGQARVLEELDRWPEALERLQVLQQGHPNPDAIERWIVAIRERREEMKR